MSELRPDRRILRASDADRERAVDFLRRHAAEGRLDVEELSDRVGKALSAKTLGELDDLAYDLPADGPALLPQAPPPPTRTSAAPFIFGRVALIYLLFLFGLGVGRGMHALVVPLVLVLLFTLRMVRRTARRAAGSGRRSMRGGPPWGLPF